MTDNDGLIVYPLSLSLTSRYSEEEAQCEADPGGDLPSPLAGGPRCLAAGRGRLQTSPEARRWPQPGRDGGSRQAGGTRNIRGDAERGNVVGCPQSGDSNLQVGQHWGSGYQITYRIFPEYCSIRLLKTGGKVSVWNLHQVSKVKSSTLTMMT